LTAPVEPGRQLPLGKSRPPRGGDRTGIDNQADAGAVKLVEHCL
jgi:hypothetical protein